MNQSPSQRAAPPQEESLTLLPEVRAGEGSQGCASGLGLFSLWGSPGEVRAVLRWVAPRADV